MNVSFGGDKGSFEIFRAKLLGNGVDLPNFVALLGRLEPAPVGNEYNLVETMTKNCSRQEKTASCVWRSGVLLISS